MSAAASLAVYLRNAARIERNRSEARALTRHADQLERRISRGAS